MQCFKSKTDSSLKILTNFSFLVEKGLEKTIDKFLTIICFTCLFFCVSAIERSILGRNVNLDLEMTSAIERSVRPCPSLHPFPRKVSVVKKYPL